MNEVQRSVVRLHFNEPHDVPAEFVEFLLQGLERFTQAALPESQKEGVNHTCTQILPYEITSLKNVEIQSFNDQIKKKY